MKKKLITRICVCAILAALYFVFDLISIKAGPFKLSVSGLPIILVAIIYGPLDAMIVGFTGAFLGQLLSYGFTPTTILWCLPAVVRGLFVGLFTKKLNCELYEYENLGHAAYEEAKDFNERVYEFLIRKNEDSV